MSSGASSLWSPNPFAIARDKRWGNPELADLEERWDDWLVEMMPEHFAEDFAEHQGDFWDWVWSIERGETPDPPAFVAVWARGGAKSTNLEASCVSLGARRRRKYVLYVCDIQDRADDHVGNIESMIAKSTRLAEAYPSLAMRAVGMYGASKGWRRNRLRTGIGLTVDAMGLDSAARGAKVDEDRPDLIILDDIDDTEDSIATILKKVRHISRKLIPAGSKDLAVAVGQNLVHRRSIVSHLARVAPEDSQVTVDFIADRKVSGPIPALRSMEWEWQPDEDGVPKAVITKGVATWSGQDLKTCQAFVSKWGITAFIQEAQHEVDAAPGGIWDHIDFFRVGWGEHPPLVDIALWVDPAVTNKDTSDSQAIQADGLGSDGKLYRLFSWERRASPEETLELAYSKAYELGVSVVGVETDQGGDTWYSVAERAHDHLLSKDADLRAGLRSRRLRRPRFEEAKAGEGHGSKVHRNQLMLSDYERAKVVHVIGTHQLLERALKRFSADPKSKPWDLADVAYWSWYWFMEGRGESSEPGDDRLKGRR